MNKIDNILKNVPIKTNEDSTDITIHSFTPMLDQTLEKMNKYDNPNDSTCTKFIRKKFICIIVLLMALITMMNLFGAITEKLSHQDVQQIYRGMAYVVKKVTNHDVSTKNNSTYIPIIPEYDVKLD
jgi:hypothetical protein